MKSWRHHDVITSKHYVTTSALTFLNLGLFEGVGFYLNRASPQLKCSTLKGVSSTNPIFYLFNVYTKVTVYHFEVQIFDLKKFHLLQYLHFMIVVQSELLSAIRGPPSGLLSAGYHFEGLLRTDCIELINWKLIVTNFKLIAKWLQQVADDRRWFQTDWNWLWTDFSW